MANNFNPLDQSLDIEYLLTNGWTIPGNLAYRHILHEYLQNRQIETERIEEIIIQYDCADQTDKIKGYQPKAGQDEEKS